MLPTIHPTAGNFNAVIGHHMIGGVNVSLYNKTAAAAQTRRSDMLKGQLEMQ